MSSACSCVSASPRNWEIGSTTGRSGTRAKFLMQLCLCRTHCENDSKSGLSYETMHWYEHTWSFRPHSCRQSSAALHVGSLTQSNTSLEQLPSMQYASLSEPRKPLDLAMDTRGTSLTQSLTRTRTMYSRSSAFFLAKSCLAVSSVLPTDGGGTSLLLLVVVAFRPRPRKFCFSDERAAATAGSASTLSHTSASWSRSRPSSTTASSTPSSDHSSRDPRCWKTSVHVGGSGRLTAPGYRKCDGACSGTTTAILTLAWFWFWFGGGSCCAAGVEGEEEERALALGRARGPRGRGRRP
mmetsp:Transcript_2708/g.9317  ORF Transcript_2708/g.9317 Transcript_2708/m.9317 type:complete len:296 (-) Transcript_2708:160-1047(-)